MTTIEEKWKTVAEDRVKLLQKLVLAFGGGEPELSAQSYRARDRLIDAHRRHHQAKKRGVGREQPLARPGWEEQSSLDLAGQLVDQELTPASRKTFVGRFLNQRMVETVNRFTVVSCLEDQAGFT